MKTLFSRKSVLENIPITTKQETVQKWHLQSYNQKSNEMLPFDPLVFTRLHTYSKGDVKNREIDTRRKLPLLYEEDGSGNKYNTADGFSFSTGNHQVERPLKYLNSLDDLFLDSTPPFPSYELNMQELANIESQYSELIKPQTQSQEEAVRYKASGPKMSTNAIIRLGGERFIQSYSTSTNNILILNYPYGSSSSGLSDEEVKDVQLIVNLLLSAEKVTKKQFERSINLLDWCDALSCSSGNAVQRIVHYFSKALREKIDNETRRVSSSGLGKKLVENLADRVMSPNPRAVLMYDKLPLYQAGLFSGVQALVDGVSGSKNVHVIDLTLKHGVHCTILMQALVSQPNCPIEHLKITAVGTDFKQETEQTGEWLKSFAESINLSFSFNAVIVEDMLDFNKDLLELDPDEALGVNSSYGLWSMIAQQDHLVSLVKVIKSINPRVMVMLEVAVNLNSPTFVNRFIGALFYYGALFDSLEDCLGREDESRGFTESMYLSKGIQNIVASEGAERVIRHVHIDVWRQFFARFGMKEVELSMSSLFQANLVVEKFPCGSSCTFDKDGDSLVICWKGTPLHCVSAWKFS